MKPKPPAAHPYIPDDITDPTALKPPETCATCGLPRANQHHTLPAVAADITEAEARKLGEH